jgi:tetratricopeptide (TPR) repeat protein
MASMSLDTPDHHYCEAAQGYAELGMFDDANEEVENVDPFNRTTPEVLRVRAAIYHGLKKWELLRVVTLKLTQLEPTNVQWTISLAYATRRAVSIEFARDILLAAKWNFPKEPVIPFNLARYYCRLGELDTAKNYLREAFAIDPQWRAEALEDKDLESLWDSLSESQSEQADR